MCPSVLVGSMGCHNRQVLSWGYEEAQCHILSVRNGNDCWLYQAEVLACVEGGGCCAKK